MNKDLNKISINTHVLPTNIKQSQEQPSSPCFGARKMQPTSKGAGKYGQSQVKFLKQNPKQSYQQKIITQAQLNLHNNKNNAWISLKGIVYDVTEYLKYHPGGDILLDGCGAESQSLFNENHSWVSAPNILKKWVIGKLEK